MVKNPPAIRETWVRSLGWEDTLEKGMVTHSSMLAWRIPWTEKPGGLQSMGSKRVGHDSHTHTHTHTHTYTYMLNPDVLLLHTTLPTSLTPNPKFVYVTGTQ